MDRGASRVVYSGLRKLGFRSRLLKTQMLRQGLKRTIVQDAGFTSTLTSTDGRADAAVTERALKEMTPRSVTHSSGGASKVDGL